jgi:hypothetical protein
MLIDPGEAQLAKIVAEAVHAGDHIGAARLVTKYCQLGIKVESKGKADDVLQNYLHHIMNQNGLVEAASILWTPTQFTYEPQFTKQLWQLFDESNQGLIMGAASCSKSYAIGVRIFLEWLRDPKWTSVLVLGPNEKHLERNLFSHLVRLHSTATLPMPGEVGALFIGLDRRDQLGALVGLVIPKGATRKSGVVQGSKRISRTTPHSTFGPSSRLFIFVDEIENVPGGLWEDIDNVLSQVEEEGNVDGFKIFGAFNPTDRNAEVGKRAEPPFGWDNFEIDKHYRWKSIRGWDVLRLDGEKCENVVQGRIIFPGLQHKNGLEVIARNRGGKESAGYYSMGRGAYPPSGVTLSIIPPGMIPKIRAEYLWFDTPSPVGSCDIALEGGDAAVFTFGRWGRVTGIKYPPSLQHPSGHTAMFKNRFNVVTSRWGLQVDQQIVLPKGDTPTMKDAILKVCKTAGIRPHFFCVDHTGHGRGVADLLKNEWSSAIHAVNYSDGPSLTKLMQEDSETCAERYDRLCAELWFAMRSFMEFGLVLLNPSMDLSVLTPQLTTRNFRPAGQGRKDKVESKRDFMTRTGQSSPNEADSVSLLIHAARKGSGFIPSMRGEDSESSDNEDEGWESWGAHPSGVRIDPSNMADYLNDRIDVV